jgi:hypothetical protein
MIEKHPLSDRLLKGQMWRYWAPRLEEHPPKPEIMEVVRRAEAMEIRAYEERRRRRDAERDATG